MNLKSQLRAYLQRLGISPAELARRSGVARQVLSDWLAGKAPRNLEHVKKVSDVLGTSVDHLCFGNGIESSERESIDLEDIIGDRWISGLFEVRLRRVKGNRKQGV